MPNVEQYDWDKLRPKQPVTKYIHKPSTKLKRWLKTSKKPKRIKAIDPSIREYHDKALRGLFKNL